jgi:hypothetical protein
VTVPATLLDSRYLLDEEIGAGGSCEVWRATDCVLTRPVAVKLLHPAYARQPEALARFKAEARHAGALSHDNIARVYDYGEPEHGQSYLVMELIEGPSLDTVLADGPLDAARTMDIVAQAAAGLQAAHSAGLIHRDIKPSNIMLAPDDTVRITDFGIAHSVSSVPLTATGTVLGSPGYIAPERAAGARGGPTSDLYALGIVAYECLAGTRPFTGAPLEVAIAHRDRPLPPLPAWVPAEVAAFVMMLTAKDPGWRPHSADEVARQARWLREQLAAGAIRARRAPVGLPSTTTGTQGSERRRAVPPLTRADRPGRLRLLAAAVVALAVLACLTLVTVAGMASTSHPATRPPQAAPSPPGSAPASAPAAPTGTRPAARQSSGSPSAATRELAADGQTSALQPGPPGHEHHPPHAPGDGPPAPALAPGTATGTGTRRVVPGSAQGEGARNVTERAR